MKKHDTSPHTRYVLPARSQADWFAFVGLMVASFTVFFINLTASGYANEFYSAAAQAGSTDWWAFLWGSSDAGNSITVDKPPAAIWLMALSIRIFGLNSFAILLPEALLGVATCWLIYSITRRYWGHWSGIIAGVVFITTPVAALMFRFNNPDALLVFLEVAAVGASLRPLEYDTSKQGNSKRTLWMITAGITVGLGFLTKQLQILLVLPGIAVAFLIASPTKIWRRIVDGLVAVLAALASSGWWVLLTVLVPADKRPYIGGSQNNSFIELTFGYNGIGRITGDEVGSVVPGGSGKSQGGMWGQTGWTRLFSGEFDDQITWLVFAALVGFIVALVVAGTKNRTDIRRASAIMFGGWLVITWLIFSFMSGIFHAYYTVALAPPIAVLSAICIALLWTNRHTIWAPFTAAAVTSFSAVWAYSLIIAVSGYEYLAYFVAATGVIGAILFITQGFSNINSPTRKVSLTTILASLCATASLLSGPIAWTGATIATGHRGSLVTAGPGSSRGGGPGGFSFTNNNSSKEQ